MTVADPQDRLSRLSPAKRALLLEKLRRETVQGRGEERIPRRPDGAPAVLSFAQQRLWFVEQLAPGGTAYNIAFGVRLRGDLRMPAFLESLREIERRHEILRTSFASTGDGPLQIVSAPRGIPLPVADLEALPALRRLPQAERLAEEVARRPFDLERGPLLRLALARLGDRDHLALFCIHHLIFDGWSQEIFLTEIAALYSAFAAGRPSPLPEPPIQYADFAEWQRRHLREERLDSLLRHWSGRLAGAPTRLELPTDRPRPTVQSFRGAVRPFSLSAELTGALREVGRRGEATTFMTLLAAWGTLLARLGGQNEVLIGSPVANRQRPELESLIGCFVNTLVLRVSLDGDPGFADLIARVRAVALDAYDHQDLPLERLLEELRLDRELSHSPLFQAVFVLQNTPGQAADGSGLSLNLVGTSTGTAKFDLVLSLTEGPDGIYGHVEHSTDLFDAATIDHWIDSFQALLSDLTANPGRSVGEAALLSAAQRRMVLCEWNGSLAPAGEEPCLHRTFEERAARVPEAVALVADGEPTTYEELNRRATELALHLRRLGVGPEVRVGICLERSADLVVSILATLKAGGAYVPLDPSYPSERLRFLLEDSGSPVLLTRGELRARLPETAARVVPLEEVPTSSVEEIDRFLASPHPSHPDNAAYVIYTSGSTGRPKGVVVTHAQVSRLFTATRDWFGFDERDVWTLFHSYAFDFSVWEIWGALLHGGRLVVVPYLLSRSPEGFLDLLRRERVTVLNQTPSAFRQLIRAEETVEARELALRWVVFGGEALELQSLEPWFDRHGDERPRLVNMYGITETTVHVTYRPLDRGDLRSGAGSVVGEPIPDLRLYLLDRRGELLPPAVPGEIHVGGAGLARGYLGRPELTAERFVPNPFEGSGTRLYRSGDLARYRWDGELEYLGRIDHQVKVRGFRIELGEVESALTGHPSIAESVVVTQGTAEALRLLAYVVVRAGASAPSVAELRDFLGSRLPDHLIPSAFVPLDAVPLTAHGKVDRRALPDPENQRLELGQEHVAPRTLLEEALAAIWERVLGVDRIGIHDNFFALGGDSIRSIQALALAREQEIGFSLQQLFRHQTIAGLAAEITATGNDRAAALRTEPFSLVREEDRPRLPEGVEDAYPLSTLQAGMLYHMELTPEEPLYHNVDSWHLRGRFVFEALRLAMQRAVDRHEVLRTSFDLASYSEPLQLVHRAVSMDLTWDDLCSLDEVAQEALIDAHVAAEKLRLCDPARPPLLRFHVHQRADDRFQLTMTENHAIWDGWSLHATLAEIFTDYFALLRGETPAEPPARTLHFRDFVALEREAVESAEQRRFWDGVVAGGSILRLPRVARRLPAAGTARIRILAIPFPEELHSALRRTARETGVPFKSVLLAAHLKVLGVSGGQTDVTTGIVTNGRPEDMDGERLRGLFLNTLPLRVQLAGGSWADIARRAFEAERDMLPFRRYPGAVLQQRRGGTPLFEAVFNYIHFHSVDAVLRSGDIEVLGFRKSEGTNQLLMAHFDHVGLQLEYDSVELDDAQIGELGARYRMALERLAREPFAPHDAAPLLTDLDRQQVAEWNDRTVPAAWGRPVLELFAEQATRNPGATAISFGDREMTYAELASRALALARHLRSLGVGTDVPVGLFLERSPDMIVALLGVLAAGGAYLPLDPAYPAERLAFMLEDSGAPVVCTHAAVRDRVPPTLGRLVALEELREEGSADAWPRTEPDALAYLIYTSGSTGRPKGVQIPHRALASFLGSMRRVPGLAAADALLAVTSLSFDIAGLELLLPLTTGARIVLASREEAASGDLLLGLIRRHRPTVLQATPATWRMLLDAGWSGGEGLKALCGGEALPLALAAGLTARAGSLWNMYGPTETTIWSAVARIEEGAGTTIGRPIENTRIYILDPFGHAAPVGVPGELCIGGTGLARGYAGLPGLTAERFVPDLFGALPGGRLYRTGDLACHRPGGELEFLGRLDFQVKIRGFRIELGEIEAELERQDGVSRAVVMAREDVPGDRRLVAYLVPSGGAEPAAGSLREVLRRRLPEHMVPGFFVTLGELPLTPNGKVDRKALPALEGGAAVAAREFLAPRTPAEDVVAAVWAEVLGVEKVGARDDFFELGGHSLLAGRVVSRLRAALGIELALRELFDAPTVASLAARVEHALRPDGAVRVPPLVPVPRGAALPLSFSQQRLWILDQLEEGTSSYNISYALRISGPLSPRALAASLGEVGRRHESLRTVFYAVDGVPRQVVLPAEHLPLPIVDLSGLAIETRSGEALVLAAREAERPYDLARGPLWRAALLRLSAVEHVVCLGMHHIVSDGWSIGILVREVAALYAGFATGSPMDLPELPVQYADFSVWQRGWLQGDVLEREISYWRDRLAGVPPLELPTDALRPPAQTYRGASAGLTLPPQLSAGLHALSRREGASLFMTLLAAFDVVLARHSGQDDIAVGVPVANRDRAEVEGLIGFFLNTLVLRTDLSGDPTLREVLRRVRESSLGAYAHQDVPFEKLLEELQPERDLGRTPLFQVFFNMLNFPVPELSVAGLTIEPLALPEAVAKFDLTAYIAEDGAGLHVNTIYNADLFDRARMEEMLRQLQGVLVQMIERPDAPVRDVSMLTAEAAALLPDPVAVLGDDWHGAVHALFAERARLHPERAAVTDEEGVWSYGELAEAAARLAARLRADGLAPGDPVAILAHRGASVAWAVMGTLWAGGAFVMLDPAYPPVRLAETIALAAPRYWLQMEAAGAPPAEVEETLRRLAAEGVLLGRLVLPAGGPAGARSLLATLPAPVEPAPVEPDSLAYLAFTSGSTGTPKGIQGRHGPLSHFLPFQRERFGMDEEDRYTLLSGLAHDPLQRDLFTPLCLGGRLSAPPAEDIATPGRLAAWMAREEITVSHLTPAMAQVLTETGAGPAPLIPTLRWVLLVGDALRRLDVERLRRIAPRVVCVNLYGSTETQRAVAHHVVEEREITDERAPQILPLGRGMRDVQLLVVSRAAEPPRLAGVGEVGEIWVRSPHLARGYLRDEALTAERFLLNPFTGAAGDRVYRTGDLGRYRPDGEVTFAGRADQQVKVRGFRIELGEIEAHLQALPQVRAAVVVAHDHGESRRLVVYFVPEGGGETSPQELREALLRRLPEPMVPSVYVAIDRIPLTPNGKVDRRALPPPDASLQATAARVAPCNAVEEALCAVWREVLGLDEIGVEDNFFALGGDSILAIQVAARSARVGLRVTVRQVFLHQTVARLAGVVEPLAPEGPRTRTSPLLLPAGLSDRPVEDAYPLSPLQQGLLFHARYEAGQDPYFQQISCGLHGDVDPEALADAWQQLIDRHPALRTGFVWEGLDTPLQVVEAGAVLPLHRESWRGLSTSECAARLDGYLEADRQRGMELSRPPLMRVALFETGHGHQLVWSRHHIVLDGWSSSLLMGELLAIYDALRQGREAVLEPVRPYRDYIDWLRGFDPAAAEAFWRSTLRGLTVRTPLPEQRAVSLELPPEERFADRLLVLSAEASEHLHAFARAHRLTPNTLLQGAWALLLARYAGLEDVVFGAVSSGRPPSLPGVERMVGLFINTLPVRVEVDAEAPLGLWLAALQEHQSAASEHEHAPLSEVQGWSELPRGEALFESFLAFENFPMEQALESRPDGLEIADLRLISQTTYPLNLIVTGGERLAARLRFDAGRLEEAGADRLLDRLRIVLESFPACSGSRLGDLPWLGAEEIAQLTREWNQTRQDYGPLDCLHELVAEQARRTPGATALVAEGESLTYAELMERARLLAAHLIRLGIGFEGRVALLLDRGPEAVTAILAVLEAGGAYVPLDPDHPAERLGFLIADSRPAALITVSSLLARVPGIAVPVVCLDRDAAAIAAADLRALSPARVTPDSLAYVIYTSGSTGTPKGVMVSHRAIANRVLWMRAALPVGAEDRVALKTLLGFDASIWEIFLPLISGARLVLARPDGHRDSSYLAELVAAEGITVLQLVPSMLGAFLEEPRVRQGLPLRRLFCGGEALPAERVRRFYELLPEVELHNLYGPTESSIDATHWAVRPEHAARTIPIGRPIGNVQVYMTDRELRPVPVGVGGELCIGGVGLARGYHGRPELTADRFIPDPFSGEPGARLYRTGDLARVVPDGVVEFLDRLDHQVKIRGYRIELGEIEAVLLEHAAVREAVAMVREQAGDRRLVAYVVPRPDLEPPAAELRGFLRERLPEHMVPGSFVFLEALPVTANGKLNRRALPDPPAADGGVVEAVAPRTVIEDLLAGIWANLLGRERIGVTDEFFALGGHSLLATQVASRVRAALRVDVPLRTLLANPTVAAQAAEVEALLAGRRGLEAPPIVPVPRDRPLPLSFAQQRLWIVQQLDPASAAFNIPMAVRLQGRLDLAAVVWSFTEIHRRHEVLRTTFTEVGRQPVQRIAAAADPHVGLIDLQPVLEERRSAVIDELVREELLRPFDLERGPLQRIVLVRQSPDEHVAILTTHHSVSDAWSTGILIRELAALYRAHGEGSPSPLPELPVQYADFAWWQRQWLQGEVLETHLDFWRRQLEGAPPLLALPTDRPRPAVASPHGRVRSYLFSEGLGERLRAASRGEGVTLFMLLLAGFYALLRHLTGEDDLVVGTDVANRNRIETEPMIGFFVNQLVLRGRVPAEGSFRDLLEQVRETTLESYAHQDVPFDKIVEVLRPERSLAYAPVFQVKLNVQNMPAQVLEVPGLTLAPLDFSSTTSQLDLIVNVVDDGKGFFGSVHYNTDLFLAETISDWWADYEMVLSAGAERPEISLAELGEMLAASRQGRQAERERQLEQASLDRLKRGRRSAVRIPAGATPADGF
jgi:amino acid adenylation domain-containing protein